jgi:hypothetical protein
MVTPMSGERVVNMTSKSAWKVRELELATTAAVVSALEALTATGFYGDSVEATAEILLCKAIRDEMPFLRVVKGDKKR